MSLAALYRTIATNPSQPGSSAAAQREDAATLRAAAKAYRARQTLAARGRPATPRAPPAAHAAVADVDRWPPPRLEGLAAIEALVAAQRRHARNGGGISGGDGGGEGDGEGEGDGDGEGEGDARALAVGLHARGEKAEEAPARGRVGGSGARRSFRRLVGASVLAGLFNKVRWRAIRPLYSSQRMCEFPFSLAPATLCLSCLFLTRARLLMSRGTTLVVVVVAHPLRATRRPSTRSLTWRLRGARRKTSE
jgi:hypothetical protein